ncbi:hypothetical protein [Parafrankia sp. EAN1pec]
MFDVDATLGEQRLDVPAGLWGARSRPVPVSWGDATVRVAA